VNMAPPAPPAPYGPPTGFYEYDEPMRRRSIWPWLLAALLVVAAVAGGWYVYTKIQDQLNQTKPVSVPLVQGSIERLAVQKLEAAGLKVQVRRLPNDTVDVGRVFDQSRPPGERTEKGNLVVIKVSSGKPKVTVPGVVGQQATDAVAALTSKGLKVKVHNINSDKETGTVTGQDPKAGTRLVKGDTVRINVSQGPKPVPVPPVVGSPYESAASTLQGAGFAVARRDVESNEPKGVVVQQDPSANSVVGPGTTVTLSVSKGPTVAAVPDVTSFSRADAVATLRNSGFKVLVEIVDTTDSSQDGVVLTQTPGPGESAKPGATITVTVGRYTAPPPPTTTQPVTTEPTPLTPTTTATTPTTP
jgi:eukaryotic-like serine/threonine-protein kinase